MPNPNLDRFLGPPGVINTREVPPGPVAQPEAGSRPNLGQIAGPLLQPGQGPVPTPQGPQAGSALGPPGPALVPAPNSQGALTPEQVEIVGAVISDPVMLETVINLAAQQVQGPQASPAAPPVPVEAALFGGR